MSKHRPRPLCWKAALKPPVFAQKDSPIKDVARESMRVMAETIAFQARQFADAPVSRDVSGAEALRAFAAAIIVNNRHHWGDEGEPS